MPQSLHRPETFRCRFAAGGRPLKIACHCVAGSNFVHVTSGACNNGERISSPMIALRSRCPKVSASRKNPDAAMRREGVPPERDFFPNNRSAVIVAQIRPSHNGRRRAALPCPREYKAAISRAVRNLAGVHKKFTCLRAGSNL